jgi:hypothetical protein
MTIQSHIVENTFTVNYELKIMWKEAIVVYSKYYLSICLEELRTNRFKIPNSRLIFETRDLITWTLGSARRGRRKRRTGGRRRGRD